MPLSYPQCFEILSQSSFYLIVRYEISFYHLETSVCDSILVWVPFLDYHVVWT